MTHAVAAMLLVSAFAQGHSRSDARSLASVERTVFTGQVLDERGRPARDVRVETSAGGETLTGADGSFALVANVPLAAEIVDVSARSERRGDTFTASVRLVPSALTSTTAVGTLMLVPSPSCTPRWLPTFGGMPGTDDEVHTLATFDDGTGPALYAGGEFEIAGGSFASCVARWNGARWSPLGSGVGGGAAPTVDALVSFDDGSGPALYVGGNFSSAGGIAANRVARWDGTSWSALGSGINGFVYALAAFDDGGGPALYAAGDFLTAGGDVVNSIARWDGIKWNSLGSGIDGFTATVRALAVFDDGSGPALYAGGHFNLAGGMTARGVARWDGTSWSAVGSVNPAHVFALAVFDDGSGAALYAGGDLLTASGVTVNHLARWDGATWSALGVGTDARVETLAVFDDGNDPAALYVGGTFTHAGGGGANRIARWNGAGWSALGGGTGADTISVLALAVFDREHGEELIAGGRFVHNVKRWDGADWSDVGRGVARRVEALATFDDGSGAALHAAGVFTKVGGDPDRIGRWDGAQWSTIDSVVTGSDEELVALVAFDDGSGPAFYVGGAFTRIDGVVSNGVARWDGTSWSALGSGIAGNSGLSPATVRAFAVFDDGSGAALYAAGHFTTAGGGPATDIARWDGSSWSALGSGIGGVAIVYALAVFDDGSGPALYAGGSFTAAGGVSALGVARWDGSTWSALGGGVDSSVRSLAVFDDGSGSALYAGGTFANADGAPASRIARWDGATWSNLKGGANNVVEALVAYDDGTGPALFASGGFTTVDGLAALHVARWDGTQWTALAGGLTARDDYAQVHALSVFDDGAGPALFAGGSFLVSPSGDSHLAKWACGRKVLRTDH